MSSVDAGGVWGTLWDNLDRLVMKILAKMIMISCCFVPHENMENATIVFFYICTFFSEDENGVKQEGKESDKMLVDKILFSYFQNANGVTNDLESCEIYAVKMY